MGESGRLVLEIVAGDEASQGSAAELSKSLQGKHILGLVAEAGRQALGPCRKGRRLLAG